jgi:thymidylate synthase ThyX
MHEVKILKDSIICWPGSDKMDTPSDRSVISDSQGRLTTFVVTYPRIIHGEVMTHRVFTRNSASSRAIPIEKMIQMATDNPYIPTYWGKNKSGMQAEVEVSEANQEIAKAVWLDARDAAVKYAKQLSIVGIHKETTNRLLEPFMWHTVLITSDLWENFFQLRMDETAHPEIRTLSRMMHEEMLKSYPVNRAWHIPFIDQEVGDSPNQELLKVAAARCARLSYLNHFAEKDDAKDIKLHDRLLDCHHMSPFEHVAFASSTNNTIGNFNHWYQYRHLAEYMKKNDQPFETLTLFRGL